MRESRTCCPSRYQRLWYAYLSRTSKHAEASRRICDIRPKRTRRSRAAHSAEYIHIHISHLPLAAILTEIEIYQISDSQERASSKRFHYVCRPTRIARDRASALRSAIAKITTNFQICNSNFFLQQQCSTDKSVGILRIKDTGGLRRPATILPPLTRCRHPTKPQFKTDEIG